MAIGELTDVPGLRLQKLIQKGFDPGGRIA